MESVFHYKNGLYFKRNEDHSVTIRQTKIDYVYETTSTFEVTIDENDWALIVSSVSKSGEENGRFYEALKWHNE